MPTKATIVTRTGKGSPLSTAEMDANLTNLRDQSIGIADDGSTVISVESGNTLTIAGAGTVSTAVSGQTLTLTGSGISASSTDTLTNKTIDANGTGNAISNLEVADFAGSAIVTVSETLASNDVDTALVTAGAIIDYVDAQDANIASDTLTFTNKTFDVEGTGNSISNIDVADLKSGVLDTDLASVSASDDTLASAKAIKSALDGKIADVVSDTTPQLGGDLDVNGNSIVSVSNGNIVIQPNGTGDIDLDGEVRFNKSYKEDINSLTSSSTITVDCSLAPIHTVTLATNTGFVISNLPTGGTVSIVITQDGTGSRTATFGTDGSTAVKFPGGAPTLTTTASGIDVVTIVNDGTNYLGNIAQAFA